MTTYWLLWISASVTLCTAGPQRNNIQSQTEPNDNGVHYLKSDLENSNRNRNFPFDPPQLSDDELSPNKDGPRGYVGTTPKHSPFPDDNDFQENRNFPFDLPTNSDEHSSHEHENPTTSGPVANTTTDYRLPLDAPAPQKEPPKIRDELSPYQHCTHNACCSGDQICCRLHCCIDGIIVKPSSPCPSRYDNHAKELNAEPEESPWGTTEPSGLVYYGRGIWKQANPSPKKIFGL